MNEVKVADTEDQQIATQRSEQENPARRDFIKKSGGYAAATTVGLAALMTPGKSSVAASDAGPG